MRSLTLAASLPLPWPSLPPELLQPSPPGISVGLFGSMTGLGFMAMVHMCCPKDPTDADRLCGQRGTTRARLLARSDPKDNTMFGWGA